MNICYLITLYHKFDQAVRMISRLAGENVSFVIHVDAIVDDYTFEKLRTQLAPLGVVLYAKRVRSKWGTYNGALAIANCIDTAVLNIKDFDRCILLSGQDYPISNKDKISEFFRNNVGTEFIEAVPMNLTDAGSVGWSPYYRFRRYHFWLGNRRYKIPILRKTIPELPMYHGSTWWALSRDAIVYIDNEIKRNVKLQKFLKSGFLVEEVYLPTLIMSSPFSHMVSGRNTTFDQWSPASGPHPKILEASDFDQLVASPKLFARKFDADLDSRILDMLDMASDLLSANENPS
jgi:hypothetical protein